MSELYLNIDRCKFLEDSMIWLRYVSCAEPLHAPLAISADLPPLGNHFGAQSSHCQLTRGCQQCFHLPNSR